MGSCSFLWRQHSSSCLPQLGGSDHTSVQRGIGQVSWQTENDFDAETTCILKITEHFLAEYFGHSESASSDLITEYFRRFDIPYVENFIAHELSWEMAKRIHFTIGLGGDRGKFPFWEVDNKLTRTPAKALEYMRKHYWEKHPNFD